MLIWDLLERARSLHGSRTAIATEDGALTYERLRARTVARAAQWSALGATRGSVIAILAHNRPSFLESYYAAAAIGAVLAPLNVRLAPSELAWILADCSARLLVVDAELEDLARAVTAAHSVATCPLEFEPATPSAFAPVRRAPDDVAHLYYTSGTTARPKGVMLTERNVTSHALGAIAELALGEGDVWGHFAPMFHLADAWATFAITWVGGTHAFCPHFEEARVLQTIERQGVTLTNLVPTMLSRLVHAPGVERRDFSRLRRVLSGGAPIAPTLVRRIMDVFGAEYVQTYGMTETSPYLTMSLLKEDLKQRSASDQFAFRSKTGRPFLGVELRVVDDDGFPVAADGRAVGEIQARGDSVTPGYWNRPEETRAAFTADGWLRTGDLATLDAEGYLDIVDRRKDVIITGGEKVYSTEVEHRISEHPAVLECAVFGVEDPLWGERVAAAVVLRPSTLATAEELTEFVRQRLAGFKVPRRVDFLAALPKTGSGKISKRTLREAARGAPPA